MRIFESRKHPSIPVPPVVGSTLVNIIPGYCLTIAKHCKQLIYLLTHHKYTIVIIIILQ